MSKHNLKYVLPHEITPYYNNPRNNDAAVPKVAESIQAYGFQQPILVDEKMEILAGHTRWKAALVLNLEKVPVVVSHGLDEKQKRAYRIADNRFGELVDWDFQKLMVELEDVGEMPIGFDKDEVSSLLEESFSAANKELQVTDMELEMVIKLKYPEEQYWQVKEALAKIADTPEEAVLKLLN